MKIYGLIGYPLSHSFSPSYFNAKFKTENIDAVYQLFPIAEISLFPQLIADNPNIAGLNVTIPYKQQVIPYLDELSAEAKAIGAVNTIVFQGNKLIGHNTDAFGFEQTLLGQENIKNGALVFGTGGASKAVQFVLKKHGIQFNLVGRQKRKANLCYEEITEDLASKNKLWINCTPVGMFPDFEKKLNLPYSSLSPGHSVIDLVYNPELTTFMKAAQEFGAKTVNGLQMLHNQAQKAWDLWHA